MEKEKEEEDDFLCRIETGDETEREGEWKGRVEGKEMGIQRQSL